MTVTRPKPQIDHVSRGFWENAERGVLSVQRCDECGHTHFPGCQVCPDCLSTKQSWAPVSGRGTLLSFVRFHRAYWEGLAAALPYLVVLVQLEEGPVLYSNLTGDQERDPPIGAALEVVFERADGQPALPVFRLAG